MGETLWRVIRTGIPAARYTAKWPNSWITIAPSVAKMMIPARRSVEWPFMEVVRGTGPHGFANSASAAPEPWLELGRDELLHPFPARQAEPERTALAIDAQ